MSYPVAAAITIVVFIGIAFLINAITNRNIKIVRIPDFPWICGEDLFQKQKYDYTFKKD
jgi:hypothetical protein